MINLVYQDNVWAVVGSIEGDAAHTEGIIVHLQQDDINNLLTHMKQNGMCIPVFLPWAPGQKSEILSKYYHGNLYQIIPFSQYDNPIYNTFARNYKQRYCLTPYAAAAYTYDAVHIIVACIQKSGLNRSGLREVIASISYYQRVTGKISWDNSGGNKTNGFLVIVEGK